MKTPDTELRQTFKQEADELLFEDLHFDNRLKESVRRRLLEIQEPPSHKRRLPTKGWIWGSAAAAAIILILLVAAPFLLSPAAPGSVAGTQGGNNGQSEPMVGGQQPGDTLNTPMLGQNNPGDDLPPPAPGSSSQEIWVLPSIKEAKLWFGDGLLVPSYVTAGFTLREINASGPREGEAAEIVFSYVSANQSFGIFQQKRFIADFPANGKAVDINGAAGSITIGDPGEDAGDTDRNIQLHWQANDIDYMLSGILPEAEALQIARSMKSLQEE